MRWRIRGQKEKTTFDYCLRCRRTHAVDSQVALVSPFPVSADSRLKSGWNDREKVSEAAIYWQLTAFITFQVADASLFLKKEGQQTHHSNKQADASHKMRFLQPAKDTSHSQTSALPNCRQNRSRRNADNWSDLLHNEKKKNAVQNQQQHPLQRHQEGQRNYWTISKEKASKVGLCVRVHLHHQHNHHRHWLRQASAAQTHTTKLTTCKRDQTGQ